MEHKKALYIPFVILLYFFIHYTTDLWYFLDKSHILVTFFKYSVALFILLIAGYKLIKNKQRFLLAFCTLLFFFLFYGSFVDTGISLQLMESVNRVNMQMVLVFTGICVLIIVLSFLIKAHWVSPILKFWLIYCVCLIAYDLAALSFKHFPEKKYLARHSVIPKIQTDHKPPVFFLLFDMYTSDTVFSKYFHFSNGSIANYLTEEGFFVSGNAHSTYTKTYYSLCSTLNLDTLPFDTDENVEEYKKPLIALKRIEDALLPKIFEQAGYRFNNYSVFDIGSQPSKLRFSLNYHLKNALTGSTFFNRFYDHFEPDFFQAYRNIDLNFFKPSWSADVRADINLLLQSFDDAMQKFPGQAPSFNYFHFMVPHPPILYDSTGKGLPVKSRYAFNGFDDANRRYVDYTKYGNQLIRNMVHAIFNAAGRDVVIIIQGDHGYRGFPSHFPDDVRFGTLNAVYLPGKNYQGFTDTMSVLSAHNLLLKNEFNVIYPTK